MALMKSTNDRKKRFEKKDEFNSKLLHLTRVAHMKAGGRRFRFRAAMIVGDGNGRVGLGVAKGKDVAQAIEKAERSGKKKLITVPILKDTIPHQVEAKFSSVKLILKPQATGKGLLAGGPVRVVCQLAGIKNISSKILSRTKSKMNIAKAALKALEKLKAKTEGES